MEMYSNSRREMHSFTHSFNGCTLEILKLRSFEVRNMICRHGPEAESQGTLFEQSGSVPDLSMLGAGPLHRVLHQPKKPFFACQGEWGNW